MGIPGVKGLQVAKYLSACSFELMGWSSMVLACVVLVSRPDMNFLTMSSACPPD